MGKLTYRIEEGNAPGNLRKRLYRIYVDGIPPWKVLPPLKQAKRFENYYRVLSNDSAEEVLNEFMLLYGEELENELF
ncbi:hypothetical protein Goe25_02480 [Bacillus phage vB_BsuM-Goe25]|nr:hypothetical protein Goe25_00040 [Bacillus phage vB_BsuM-Goe25]WCS69876.1 hypothetical protein Goe25_02480 [Bacillus phage vB_BsuM-Goe25]